MEKYLSNSDNNMPSTPNYFKFVLTDKQFNFMDRTEFLLFWLFATGLLAAVFATLWFMELIVIVILGLPGLIAVFAWYFRLDKKFTRPFAKSQGISELQIEQQNRAAMQYALSIQKDNDKRGAVYALVFIVAMAGIFFAPGIPEIPMKFAVPGLLVAFLIEILLFARIRKIFDPIRFDAAKMAEAAKKVSMISFWALFILFVAVAFVVRYRYEAVTGCDILHSSDCVTHKEILHGL